MDEEKVRNNNIKFGLVITKLKGMKSLEYTIDDIPKGKYLIYVKGYARKEIVDRKAINYGFQFKFKKIDEFNGYKNPREEKYDFNVANMK